MKKYFLADESACLALGTQIAHDLKAGDILALSGPLGVGKTTLARGIITALFSHVDVPSPTYTLVQTYERPEYELWHCDLYRLRDPNDILELGVLDAMQDCICLIEWPEHMGKYLPEDCCFIRLAFAQTGRSVTIEHRSSDD